MTLLRKGAPQSGVMPWGWGAAQLQVNRWLARQGLCRASPTHTCLGLKACTCPSREKREGRSLALLPTPEAKSPLGDPAPPPTSTPGQETASTPTGHLRLGCQQRPETEALGPIQSSCPPQPSCPFTHGDLDSPGLQQPCSGAPGIVHLSVQRSAPQTTGPPPLLPGSLWSGRWVVGGGRGGHRPRTHRVQEQDPEQPAPEASLHHPGAGKGAEGQRGQALGRASDNQGLAAGEAQCSLQ